MQIPDTAPTLEELLAQDLEGLARLNTLLEHRSTTDAKGRYLHWSELRHKTPPGGLSAREWWLAVKMARNASRHEVPIWDLAGKSFSFSMVDPISTLLQHVDASAGGRVEFPVSSAAPSVRDRYLFASLTEEAITSSQLEGAATTRRVAKELLSSGRRARSVDERMIVNNYAAMDFVRHSLQEPCSVEMIVEIHRIISSETLERAEDEGRLRAGGERVYVQDSDQSVLHAAPEGKEVQARLDALCRFANLEGEALKHLHPVVHSVILHFGLAYIHPFVDGNGRVARALFYWSMLRHGYWIAEFLSVSRVLKKAPARYARAFLLSETDEGDLNYFILHQLRALNQAMEDLFTYVESRTKKQASLHKSLGDTGLNHRQAALIRHALKHQDAVYTIAGHRSFHNVVYQTARTDLMKLEARGLLKKSVLGREHAWRPNADLDSRVEKLRRTEK